MKNKIFITTLVGFLLSFATSFGQTEKIEAAFIYNFTSLVNWPDSYHNGNFVISVLGNSPIAKELDDIAKQKKAGAQTIVVKKVGSVAEIGNSHIVFVSDGQISKLADMGGLASTLIITESEGAATKGSMINFVQVGDKLRFELNESKANSKNLKLAPNLLKLGIPVK